MSGPLAQQLQLNPQAQTSLSGPARRPDQDAVGSVFGAQKGMLAFRAAVINRKETYLTFGGLIMRFVPMGGGRLRVQVSR
jgi:hypothetical protein